MKHIAPRVGAIALTGVALYVVLPSLTRVVGAWPELTHLSPLWLMGALLAEVASFACAFALQRLVLRTKKWFAVVAAGLTGNTVSSVLPGGDAAGAAVQFRMLDTAGISADDAAGGMTAASLLGVGGLLALPVFTLPAILGGVSVTATTTCRRCTVSTSFTATSITSTPRRNRSCPTTRRRPIFPTSGSGGTR